MGEHRKEKRYRRIVIAAIAVGAVGVPPVAMACVHWRDSGEHRSRAGRHAADAAWNNAGRNVSGNPDEATPWWTSKTATALASTPAKPAPKKTAAPRKTTAPKPRATAPSPVKTTASATPASPSAPKATATASGTVARIVQLVNAERSKAGCSPVTLNATLTKVAQAHSEDMASHRNMSHTGSDGSSPGDRITRAGYSWSTYGENVAYGYATPEQVMAGWMSSPGHRANILDCAFKQIGVGLAQPGDYWTQDFATAR
ncbi:CAP domain-containing protein [Streptomyces glomeratus]|nr:CAP domain-containing protein [Streptomyces glomeratus]MCF1508744.1 CAP domain-containing protein [Streptomyces glomeratus]